MRPTLYAYGPNEDALSRDHRVVDHAKDGAPGLFSMLGGKLASYRIFAEEMTDVLVSASARRPSRAARTSRRCPGGDAWRSVSRWRCAELGIDAVAARAARLPARLARRARSPSASASGPLEATVVCPCEPVIEAEVRHVIEHEMAATVDDVARRTRLGLGACGGMRCAARCGQIVAQERDLAPRDGGRQALRFLKRQASTRAVAMGPVQARQEALLLASIRAELGPLIEEDH